MPTKTKSLMTVTSVHQFTVRYRMASLLRSRVDQVVNHIIYKIKAGRVPERWTERELLTYFFDCAKSINPHWPDTLPGMEQRRAYLVDVLAMDTREEIDTWVKGQRKRKRKSRSARATSRAA
jgi:hypothetical protein